jgi:catechol 2,3-dioxygenase-like lactoylglutathione lyase family enzyme
MKIRAVDHLDLVVTSLERSVPFYQELLGLDAQDRDRGRARRARRLHLAPGRGAERDFALGLREKQSDSRALPYDRYAVGVHHVAFRVGSRTEVDQRAEWLRAVGAEIESGPAEYGYSEGYYAVFFYDPDGLKLELMYVPG